MVMWRNDFTFTKAHLGWALLIGGVLGFLAILSLDLLAPGREGGLGPAQSLALAFCAGLAILGLTLIPLGKAPA